MGFAGTGVNISTTTKALSDIIMNIVVVSFTYHPEANGVANAAGQMVDFFLDEGHKVQIITGQSLIPDTSKNSKLEIHRFAVHENGIFNSTEIRSYVDFLTKSLHDVIIFHCWRSWPTDIALKHISRIKGKKILLSHGYETQVIYWRRDFSWGLGSWFRRLPEVVQLPRQLASFDRVVFLSHKVDFGRFFDGWVARTLGYQNTSVIPNAVNNANWYEIPADFKKRYKLTSGSFFLCVANYSPRKNQMMALEAFCEANIPNSSLIFIGSSLGDYGTVVRNKWLSIRDLYPHIEVHFFDGLERSEIISAIRSCDIFVLSATAETQPISLLESMACGKPFISTDTGCVSEFEGGIVVASKHEMVSQMQHLASNPEEAARLGSLGKACFENEYSSPACKRAWLELIEKVVEAK